MYISFKKLIKCELVRHRTGGERHRHTLSPATPHGPARPGATSPGKEPAGPWKGVGRGVQVPRSKNSP